MLHKGETTFLNDSCFNIGGCVVKEENTGWRSPNLNGVVGYWDFL